MKKGVIIIIIVSLMLGALGGYYLSHVRSDGDTGQANSHKKALYWIDPMEPTIHYPKSGKSRMNMELVPVYSDDQKLEDPNAVMISASVVNNLGIRVAPVKQGLLPRKIEAVTYIVPNENNIYHIHTYAEGWIKKLVVRAIGESVKQDQLLVQLYSPMLINAQEEYLSALASGNKQIIESSYKKLRTLKISESQIEHVKSIRKADQLVDIFSPQNGIINELNAREGMHVTPENEIMSLVDLSSIWMIAQIFENEASWVKEGQKAQVSFAAFPGKEWDGKVDYIYPEIDPMTRTLKVRFLFKNRDKILKINMYGNITLLAEPKQSALSIPLEALIRSSQGARVIVALKNGHFQVRTVKVGIESGDRVEILSGLKEGENVVVSGQFLIDSEANLKASSERLEFTPNEGNQQQSETAKPNNVQKGHK
ncbi:MAG: efflux RND transporter periplasmic adaptor subunit [Gammaproteobacteria bacterium]|jgi:Cu(I)/Ag(I) efflux system membrane fusion protein|nr:efflux RND transporter periplasmic adaptor subunit [Gammaproteobacteria bacterium]